MTPQNEDQPMPTQEETTRPDRREAGRIQSLITQYRGGLIRKARELERVRSSDTPNSTRAARVAVLEQELEQLRRDLAEAEQALTQFPGYTPHPVHVPAPPKPARVAPDRVLNAHLDAAQEANRPARRRRARAPLPENRFILLADMTPEQRKEYDRAVQKYNGGRPLDMDGLVDLFGVESNTVYGWWPDDDTTRPDPQRLPDPLPDGGWDPRVVIPWGVMTGKIGWTGSGWDRRRLPRMYSPGKIRRRREYTRRTPRRDAA